MVLSQPAMQFSQPPPNMPNLAVPPPGPQPGGFAPRFNSDKPRMHFYQPYRPYPRPGPDNEFDGKRLRKSVMRKTVDYNSAVIRLLENRVWRRDFRDRRALQPDVCYYPELEPPSAYPDNAINSVTTRFVKTATNKMRCPVFCLAWTPEGRRLVTGASSGEFTLWNGLTFNFETILQAHDSPVRTMVWSHNDVWMVTGDHGGYVKYWQSNMNNVKMFQAHKEALRGISFSPTDQKFATCSDDGTIRIWDFLRCQEERILRGHGADVKCIHWHPQKGLIISGSKDNQQPVKLWDPKTGQSLATLHAHKSTVMDVKWNNNGNWLVTASRDHLLKLFDLRNLSTEVQTFRGHKKEASAVAWHPTHEGLFCSGGSDGAILFWHVGADKEVGGIEQAHDSIVWSLAWHPLGHILCSGSNDHTSKFWTRNRPGDQMRDKYNLNTLPAGASGYDDNEIDDLAAIPGMGPEDRVEGLSTSQTEAQIPGLDFDSMQDSQKPTKKVPYAKPIPRNFQAQWNETKGRMDDSDGEETSPRKPRGLSKDALSEAIAQFIESNPPPGVVPLAEIAPSAIIVNGKVINVQPNSSLAQAISGGADQLMKLIESGEVEELREALQRPERGSEDEDECFELRPEERDSYDEDEDGGQPHGPPHGHYNDQFEDSYDDHWSEHEGMGPNNMGPGNMGPGSMGPGNMGPGNMGPGNMGPGNMGPGNYMGPGHMRPNHMGPGNMGPNMGPNMRPNMGPNMGGPNMIRPNMGPNNMVRANMGPNNMVRPNMGGHMGPGNMGQNRGPNMGPGNNMGPNFGGKPNFSGDPRVGPAMRSSQDMNNFQPPMRGRGGRGGFPPDNPAGRGNFSENHGPPSNFRGNSRGNGPPFQRGGSGGGEWGRGRPPWEQGNQESPGWGGGAQGGSTQQGPPQGGDDNWNSPNANNQFQEENNFPPPQGGNFNPRGGSFQGPPRGRGGFGPGPMNRGGPRGGPVGPRGPPGPGGPRGGGFGARRGGGRSGPAWPNRGGPF